jgi:gamma-glutamylcyclotransferase (GGCT)/AIG2-like uncharacterized protein YtfP
VSKKIEDDGVQLFSYGTLQQPEVQLANFGRLLEGRPDTLPGYALSLIEIEDAHVVALSGSSHHPIVRATGDLADVIQGAVFNITADELTAADQYETDDYQRVLVRLKSGTTAWVYLARSGDA